MRGVGGTSVCVGLLAASCLLGGCSTIRDVKYDTALIAREYTAPIASSLHVRTFQDERSHDAKGRRLMSMHNEGEIDGVQSCVNGEEGYARGTVAAQVTAQIARHVQKRGAFARVTTGTAKPSDYVLSGSIGALYAAQELSTAKRVGAQYGLLGALVTSGASTKGETHVLLRDLVLDETATGRRLRLEDIDLRFEGEMDVDAYCWIAYEHANHALRDAVARLAFAVERGVDGDARRPPARPTAIATTPRPAAASVERPRPDMTLGSLEVTAHEVSASAPGAKAVVEGASVSINGSLVGTTPLQVGLRQGSYTLRVQRGDDPATTRRVEVLAGRAHVVDVSFERSVSRAEHAALAASNAQALAGRREAADAERAAWEREAAAAQPARDALLVGSIASLAVGVGAIAAGAVLKAFAANDDAQAQALIHLWRDEPSAAAREQLEPQIRDAEQDRDSKDVAGTVLLGVGVAAVATSVVLFMLRPDLREAPPAGESIAFEPVVGPQSAQLRLSGAF